MGRGFGPDDEALRDRAIELRRAGVTLAEIKGELGVGSSRLARWLAEVPPVPPGERNRPWSDRRVEAHEMRERGCSYREISAALGVPKSTLSSWLRDVPLTDEHRARLAARVEEGVRSRAEAIRAGRIRRTTVLQAESAEQIGRLTDRELFLLGVVAYACEGTKEKPWSHTARCTFVNSDPAQIRLFVRWLGLVGVPSSDLVLRLAIHETADIGAATSFWKAVVDVDEGQWRPPTLKRHAPQTNRRNTGASYRGCLVVTVRRSAMLNRRLAGWWRGIGEQLAAGPGVSST